MSDISFYGGGSDRGGGGTDTTLAMTKAELAAYENPTGSGLYPALIGNNIIVTDAAGVGGASITVNGIQPDANGNIILKADDIPFDDSQTTIYEAISDTIKIGTF